MLGSIKTASGSRSWRRRRRRAESRERNDEAMADVRQLETVATCRLKRNCIGRAASSCSSLIPPSPARRRGSLPDRRRHRTKARHAQLRTARGAGVSEALSLNRPPRRSPRRPRPGARRLRTDARVARDWGGAGASERTRGDRRGQSGGRAAAATDVVARFLWQRAHCRARLRRAGNDGSLRQSPRVDRRRQGRAGALVGGLRLMGRQLHARRVAIYAGALVGPSQRCPGQTRFT